MKYFQCKTHLLDVYFGMNCHVTELIFFLALTVELNYEFINHIKLVLRHVFIIAKRILERFWCALFTMVQMVKPMLQDVIRPLSLSYAFGIPVPFQFKIRSNIPITPRYNFIHIHTFSVMKESKWKLRNCFYINSIHFMFKNSIKFIFIMQEILHWLISELILINNDTLYLS